MMMIIQHNPLLYVAQKKTPYHHHHHRRDSKVDSDILYDDGKQKLPDLNQMVIQKKCIFVSIRDR